MHQFTSKHFGMTIAAAAVLFISFTGAAAASDRWCEEQYSSDHETFCEVREFSLAASRAVIEVDAAPNGGIRVEGWDRDEILIEAKVSGRGDSMGEAKAIASEVRIDVSGVIRADGPRSSRHSSWSVSYRLRVPHQSDLSLESHNGGIRIADVQGNVDFRTVNGGIHLDGMGGDVQGRTSNGGLRINLAGNSWDGSGLDVKTQNGGIRLEIPEDYNAHLETGTVNGGMEIDFPVTLQGRIGRELELDLGKGGQTIRLMTTNGGVKIRRM